jgi:O-6-methylguanine DNA methyltransferase
MSSTKKNRRLTHFEWRVLQVTSKIPLGQTRSYKWVARVMGKPKALRAVGQALKKNPFPLIIPCHRVIREDGSLGGYSGGKKTKRLLLKLEQEIAQRIKKATRNSVR